MKRDQQQGVFVRLLAKLAKLATLALQLSLRPLSRGFGNKHNCKLATITHDNTGIGVHTMQYG